MDKNDFPETLKAISLYEPWATLIGLGLKSYETRSWQTVYRGPLVICAAQRLLPLVQIINILYKTGHSVNDLNFGRAICVVDLIEIYRTSEIVHLMSSQERLLGDWTDGRFAWKFDNLRQLKRFPLVKQRQRLFEIPKDSIQLCRPLLDD